VGERWGQRGSIGLALLLFKKKREKLRCLLLRRKKIFFYIYEVFTSESNKTSADIYYLWCSWDQEYVWECFLRVLGSRVAYILALGTRSRPRPRPRPRSQNRHTQSERASERVGIRNAEYVTPYTKFSSVSRSLSSAPPPNRPPSLKHAPEEKTKAQWRVWYPNHTPQIQGR